MERHELDIAVKSVFDDFMQERAFVPDYAKFLAREDPEFLVKWFATRRTFRGRGVLPEKYKELLLMACNAIRLGSVGVKMHVRTAMDMGATKEEILEAAQTMWLIGGGPSLNMCIRALMEVLEEDAKAR